MIALKNKKVLLIAGAFCVVILVFSILILSPKYRIPDEARLISQEMVQKQNDFEQAMRDYVNAGEYTFSSPLVIQNPYGTAPLTALVIFDTPEKTKISIHIPGKSPEAAVDFTFSTYQTHHEIPVYGLYAGQIKSDRINSRI